MPRAADHNHTRLVIYTDDGVLAAGVSALLSASPDFNVVIAPSALFALVPFVQQAQPDAVLVDMTPETSLGLISALRNAVPNACLILWGRSFSDELRYQALEIGAAGFIHRGAAAETFAASLADIVGGERGSVTKKPEHSTTVSLTNRESQLVALLGQGLRNKEIAACIGITEGTVRIYLSRLFAKIGARDRFELAVFGLKNSFCGQASWDGENGFVTQHDEDRARPVLKSLVLVEPERRRGYSRRSVVSGE